VPLTRLEYIALVTSFSKAFALGNERAVCRPVYVRLACERASGRRESKRSFSCC
jgi:hypothetical protein